MMTPGKYRWLIPHAARALMVTGVIVALYGAQNFWWEVWGARDIRDLVPMDHALIAQDRHTMFIGISLWIAGWWIRDTLRD